MTFREITAEVFRRLGYPKHAIERALSEETEAGCNEQDRAAAAALCQAGKEEECIQAILDDIAKGPAECDLNVVWEKYRVSPTNQ